VGVNKMRSDKKKSISILIRVFVLYFLLWISWLKFFPEAIFSNLGIHKSHIIIPILMFLSVCFNGLLNKIISEKDKKRDVIKSRSDFFKIIVVACIWILWLKFIPEALFLNIHKANFIMPIIIMIGITSSMFLQKLRYDSPQFKAQNFSGSFAKPPKEIDGFWIFAIDGIKAKDLYLPRANRIAIVRKKTSQLMEEGAVSFEHMKKTTEFRIPKNVRQAILSDPDLKYGIKNIYIGVFKKKVIKKKIIKKR
jgi:hypothetical protein